jgi:DNA-binding protein HU-beta
VGYTLLPRSAWCASQAERLETTSSGGNDLNKNDLITTVANDTGLGRREAAKAVDSVFAAIAEALKGGDEVRLVGFGTFSVSERAASQGRNPRTGDIINISASKQPKFRAGKGLKDALN